MTEVERLMLYNQYLIMEKLGLETEETCNLVREELHLGTEPQMWFGEQDLPSVVFPKEAAEWHAEIDANNARAVSDDQQV
jgi:hypothetical protein